MGEVVKGTVLSVKDNRCRVAPIEDIDQVSALITIPEYIEDIEKGDTVAYTIFGDYTGIVISKL